MDFLIDSGKTLNRCRRVSRRVLPARHRERGCLVSLRIEDDRFGYIWDEVGGGARVQFLFVSSRW